MRYVEPLELWGMKKGRFGQPSADEAAFCFSDKLGNLEAWPEWRYIQYGKIKGTELEKHIILDAKEKRKL
jgi:hypothetical protein